MTVQDMDEGNPVAEETTHPAENPGEQPETPETTVEGQPKTPSEPEVKPEEKSYQKTASDFYRQRDLKREEKRLEREKKEQLKKFQEDLEAGNVQPSPETLQEAMREQDMELRTYKLRDFLSDHPEFKEHESEIKDALGKDEFQKLTIEQIAFATVGAQIIEGKAADEEAMRAAPSEGRSPRNVAPKDYRNMSLEEISREAARVMKQR